MCPTTSAVMTDIGGSFRFLDLQYDIRLMIYDMIFDPGTSNTTTPAESYSILDFPTITDGKEYLKSGLPGITNANRSIRAEAFRAFARGAIIDVSDTSGEEIIHNSTVTRSRKPKTHEKVTSDSLEQTKRYMDAYGIKCDVLHLISRVLVKVKRYRDRTFFDGVLFLKRLPNLKELIIHSESSNDWDIRPGKSPWNGMSSPQRSPGSLLRAAAKNVTLLAPQVAGEGGDIACDLWEWVSRLRTERRVWDLSCPMFVIAAGMSCQTVL